VGAEEAEKRTRAVAAALGLEPDAGRIYRISALTGQGTARLAQDLMTRLEELAAEAAVAGESGAGA
jgi:hypothetical protein